MVWVMNLNAMKGFKILKSVKVNTGNVAIIRVYLDQTDGSIQDILHQCHQLLSLVLCSNIKTVFTCSKNSA